MLDFVVGLGNPAYTPKKLDFMVETLNESQAEAVERSLEADDFHLVIGPPGTGKTFVIREIIHQLLKEKQKILVTAWTNLAVDNILERLDLNRMLRIGSKYEISKSNLKYSLQEKRKKHPDWREVERIDVLIGKTFAEMKDLKKEFELIRADISKLNKKKDVFNQVISNISKTKAEYEKIASEYEDSPVFDNSKYSKCIKIMDELEGKAENYYKTAFSLYDLQRIEEELPNKDSFYKLEDEVKGMRSRKILKKVSSIFNKKNYHSFLEELQSKEKEYEMMVESFNAYWDFHDAVDEKLKDLYPQGEGNILEDTLNTEIELLRLQERIIPLEKENIVQQIRFSDRSILLDTYKRYIKSLEKKKDLVQVEIEDLNTLIRYKIIKERKILDEIDNLRESLDKFKNDKKKLILGIDKDILSKSDVVAATVVSSAHNLLDDVIFDSVVMDEASQVASYMSLIPLLKCKKFVLVGDNKQLQPIEESELSPEMNLSLFNRLIESFDGSYTFLDTQYRMNQEIADISSQMFYENKLKTFKHVADQTLDCEFKDDKSDLINSDAPITYIDTKNLDFHEDGTGKGCTNTREAEFVAYLVSVLLENGIKPQEIGVITPYRNHKLNIKNQLENNLVEVDTVYRFQGREKDIIIISFCNSGIGRLKPFLKKFISKESQVNVAITRARKKLIIIGNSNTLKQTRLLKELLELIGVENTVQCSLELIESVKASK